MACNSDFIQYIADQCSGAGEIAVKKMMGDYCIYCNGVLAEMVLGWELVRNFVVHNIVELILLHCQISGQKNIIDGV